MARVFNFSAGPSALPEEVLNEAFPRPFEQRIPRLCAKVRQSF